MKYEQLFINHLHHGNRTVSGNVTKIKPQTSVTLTWEEALANSGEISKYELRYTKDNGKTYIVLSDNISASTLSYTFVPNAIDGQTIKAEICSVNSYGKKSSFESFNNISIYTDGLSVGKIGGNIKHLRAYVKVNGEMKQIIAIKVKRNGVIYNIDQFTPPE